jgi:hypothetical protein
MQVLRFRCTHEALCDGLGDRVIGLNLAFWLVPPSEPSLHPASGLPRCRQRHIGSPMLAMYLVGSKRSHAAVLHCTSHIVCSMDLCLRQVVCPVLAALPVSADSQSASQTIMLIITFGSDQGLNLEREDQLPTPRCCFAGGPHRLGPPC